MTNGQRDLDLALIFARRALALLDQAGERRPAVYLQRAIDEMIDSPIPKSDLEAEAALATPEALQLQRQLGWTVDEEHDAARPIVKRQDDLTAMGLHFQEWRNLRGLSLQELSIQVGIEAAALARLEEGRADLSFYDMVQLADAAGCDLKVMLGMKNVALTQASDAT